MDKQDKQKWKFLVQSCLIRIDEKQDWNIFLRVVFSLHITTECSSKVILLKLLCIVSKLTKINASIYMYINKYTQIYIYIYIYTNKGKMIQVFVPKRTWYGCIKKIPLIWNQLVGFQLVHKSTELFERVFKL